MRRRFRSLRSDTTGASGQIEMVMLGGIAAAVAFFVVAPFASQVGSRFVETESLAMVMPPRPSPSEGTAALFGPQRSDGRERDRTEEHGSEPSEDSAGAGDGDGEPLTWSKWGKLILWWPSALLPDVAAQKIAEYAGADEEEADYLMKWRAPLAEMVGGIPDRVVSDISDFVEAIPELAAMAKESPAELAIALAAGAVMDVVDKVQNTYAVLAAGDDRTLQTELRRLTQGVALGVFGRVTGGTFTKQGRKAITKMNVFENGWERHALRNFIHRSEDLWHRMDRYRGIMPDWVTSREKDSIGILKSATIFAHWVRDGKEDVIDAAVQAVTRQNSVRINFLGSFDADAGLALVKKLVKYSLEEGKEGRLTVKVFDLRTHEWLKGLGFKPVAPNVELSDLGLSKTAAQALLKERHLSDLVPNEWTRGIELAERQALRVELLSSDFRRELTKQLNWHDNIPLEIQYVPGHRGPLVNPDPSAVGSIKVDPNLGLTDNELLLRIVEDVGDIRSGTRELNENIARSKLVLKGRTEDEFITGYMRQEAEVNAQKIFFYLQARADLQRNFVDELPNQYPEYQRIFDRYKNNEEFAIDLMRDHWSAQLAPDGRPNLLVAQNRYEEIWRQQFDPVRQADVRQAERYRAPALPDPNTALPRHDALFEIHNTKRLTTPRTYPNLN